MVGEAMKAKVPRVHESHNVSPFWVALKINNFVGHALPLEDVIIPYVISEITSTLWITCPRR